MTRARPFRFGVFGENARSRGALLETARRAEDSGYATFLIRDHFIEGPFDPPGVRVDRLEEAIRVLKGLFGAGPLTFAGKHYRVTQLDGFPKPVQRPHPPILIGASGKRMLSIAAREADIIGFQTVSTANGMMTNDPGGRLPQAVTQRVEQVRQIAGERFGRIELSMVATVVFAVQPRQEAERF